MAAVLEEIFMLDIKRLKWKCRRGMLELDLLLGEILKNRYGLLPPDHQQLFDELLDEGDQDIYAWLMGTKTPDVPYGDLISALRRQT